jgi:hypothetical protein
MIAGLVFIGILLAVISATMGYVVCDSKRNPDAYVRSDREQWAEWMAAHPRYGVHVTHGKRYAHHR